MSSILSKSFNICISKLKCFPTISFSQPPAGAGDEHDQDHHHHYLLSTTEKPSILKNFNSLYESTNCYSDDRLSTSDDLYFSSSGEDSVPDFTSAFASHRFFVSSPGSSNSIFEQPPEPPEDYSGAAVSGGVAVQKHSPDPYSDFRRSMVEMIEARDEVADWEFLDELLLCYVALNSKHTHKFIFSAFADVIVSLVLPPPDKDHKSPLSATSH